MKACWTIPPKQNAAFVAAMEDVLGGYARHYDAAYPVVVMDELCEGSHDWSTQYTTAFSGGFRYNPTTSCTFSANNGSLDNLNPLDRCGLMLNAFQIRPIVDFDNPDRSAILAASSGSHSPDRPPAWPRSHTATKAAGTQPAQQPAPWRTTT